MKSDNWLDYCGMFYEGFGIIINSKGKYNHIGTKGNLLSNTWFDSCNTIRDGLSRVKLNGKFNHIGKDGKLLSALWYDYCYSFIEGLAEVRLNDKWLYIDKEGVLHEYR